MATITQRLAFLVSANADGAIKAFEKTGREAEKSLGKATRNIDALGAKMTKFGAVGLAAAGTMAALGTKFALAGERAATSNARIDQINKSMGLFGDQTAQVTDRLIKYAEATARSTGIDQNAIKLTQAKLLTFKELAATANQVGGAFDRATQAAIDLAAAGFGEAEQNATQLGKALNDPVKGLTALARSGVTFTEVEKDKIKALVESGKLLEAQNTLLTAIETQVGGTAKATSNASDRMKVAFSQFQESIGQSLLPVFEDVTGNLTGLFQGFQKVNEATGGIAAKFLAFGTVALGVASGVSLLAGQAIKLRNTFFVLDSATGKMTSQLTGLSKGLIAGTGLVTAAVVVYSAYSNKKREVQARTESLTQALKLEGEAQQDALASLIESDGTTRLFASTLTKLGLTFGDLDQAAKGNKTAFDGIRDAYEKYIKLGQFTQDRAEQLGVAIGYQGEVTVGVANQIGNLIGEIDRLAKANKATAANADLAAAAIGEQGDVAETVTVQYRSLNSMFEQNYKWSEMRNRSADRGAKLAEYQSMLEERASKSAGVTDDKRAKAAEAYAKQVDTLAGKLETKLANALKAAEDNAANANKAYADYQKTISGSVAGVVSLGDAQATAAANTKALADAKLAEADAQTDLNKVLADPNADPDKVAEARQKLADATKAVTDASKAPLTFADALKGQVSQAQGFKTGLQKVLDLGGDKALLDQLSAAGADAGGAIITGILNSSDPAKAVDELDATLANVAAFADTIGTAAADKFFGAGVKLANDLLAGVNATISGVDVEKLSKGKTPKKSLKKALSSVDTSLGALFGAFGQVPSLADGGIVPARPGGTLVRVGEGGRDEAVLPLPAMAQGGTTIQLVVNAGMGADGTNIGRQIVDELVAYQRRVGALPIKVAG